MGLIDDIALYLSTISLLLPVSRNFLYIFRDDLRDTINKLNIKVETLMQSNAKLEEHEQELAQLKLENKTLQRSNTSLQRKVTVDLCHP